MPLIRMTYILKWLFLLSYLNYFMEALIIVYSCLLQKRYFWNNSAKLVYWIEMKNPKIAFVLVRSKLLHNLYLKLINIWLYAFKFLYIMLRTLIFKFLLSWSFITISFENCTISYLFCREAEIGIVFLFFMRRVTLQLRENGKWNFKLLNVFRHILKTEYENTPFGYTYIFI